MNLYLFGGSFNPPHLGHKEIIKHFMGSSDLFVISPSYQSPFKLNLPLVSFLHRKKMIKLMLDSFINEKFLIIDYEQNNKYLYTIETIKYLKKTYEDYSIHLIIGADQFNKIESWKDYQYILDDVILDVVSRPGDVIKDSSIHYNYVDSISIDTSSSFIRKNINRIENISKVIDERVLEYILTNKLYN